MVEENMALNNLESEELCHEEESRKLINNEEVSIKLEENIEVNQNNSGNEISNGLENFELGEESPQLFNTETEIKNEVKEETTYLESDEDELEIPAFLRRQKN